jgi:hypothetical protein
LNVSGAILSRICCPTYMPITTGNIAVTAPIKAVFFGSDAMRCFERQLWGNKSGSRRQTLWTAEGSKRGPSPERANGRDAAIADLRLPARQRVRSTLS